MYQEDKYNHFILDLSIECISGQYKHNSCYINRNKIGEILGSDIENKELTINLNSKDFEKKTFQIFYHKQEYFLKNLCQQKQIYFYRNELFSCKCFLQNNQKICKLCVKLQLDLLNLLTKKTINIIHQDINYQIICYQSQDDQFKNKYTKFYFCQYLKTDKSSKETLKSEQHFEDFYQKLSQENKQKVILKDKNKNFVLDFGQNKNLKLIYYNKQFYIQSLDQPYQVLLSKEQILKLWSGDNILLGEHKFIINRLNYALFQSSGIKKNMEDKVTIEPNYYCKNYPNLQMSIFCIFDGHNGSEVSVYLQKNFIQKFLENFELNLHENILDYYEQVQKVMKKTFSEIDKEIFNIIKRTSFEIGSTALIVIVSKNTIISINLGDSRAVLCRNNTAIQLTQDQNIQNSLEKQRIIECGGSIIRNRINGTLEVTRSFGDFQFKTIGQQYTDQKSIKKDIISTEPEFTKHIIDYNQDQFLILGSDGIFQSLQNQTLLNKVLDDIKYNQDISSYQITSNLVDFVQDTNLKQLHYCDNLSLILIFLKRII